MKDPKFNIDRPDLTDEQALRHKNFDDVLQQHAQLVDANASGGNSGGSGGSSWSKMGLWGGGATLIAGIVGAYFLLSSPENPQTNEIAVVPTADSTTTAVHPPIDGLNIPYEHLIANSGQEESILASTGSMIKTSSGSFIDSDGQPVQGEVEIRYREFHDPVDFFLSGIPMTYDSAGQEYHFESAGMLEILAYQNGQPVFVNPEEPLTIELVSFQPGNQFNIYQLDTKSGAWSYQGKDTSAATVLDPTIIAVEQSIAEHGVEKTTESAQAQLSEAQNAQEKLLKKMGPAPEKANPKRLNINIDYDPKEFPELEAYKGVLFELTLENGDIDRSLTEIQWEDVRVEKANKAVKVMFRKGKRKEVFFTRPVFEGQNYVEAMALFESKNATYLEQLEQRKVAEEEAQKQLNYLALRMNQSRERQNEMARLARQAAEANQGTSATVRRTFIVSGFGIWNSDCPLNLPQGKMLAAHFQDEQGNKVNMNEVYLVEMNKNAMYKIFNNNYPEFQYDPSSENVLWGMTHDKQLAVAKAQKFRDADAVATPDSCMFTMQLINQKITKAAEVRQMLGLKF